MAISFLTEGNYEEAIAAFTKAISIDPKSDDSVAAYLGRSRAYYSIMDKGEVVIPKSVTDMRANVLYNLEGVEKLTINYNQQYGESSDKITRIACSPTIRDIDINGNLDYIETDYLPSLEKVVINGSVTRCFIENWDNDKGIDMMINGKVGTFLRIS